MGAKASTQYSLPYPRHPYAQKMIEARHLRVLRAVAATGSFSAAGRELGCTQPAVSQQMKALEASVGTPLLVRTGREMRLTQAGDALVRHAAGIIAGLTAAEEEVAAIAGLRAGRVRLVSFPSGSSTLVPTALAALRAAHPGTRVSSRRPSRRARWRCSARATATSRSRSGTRGRRASRSGTTWSYAPCSWIASSGSSPRATALPGPSRSRSANSPGTRGSRAARAAADNWSRSAAARASSPVSTSPPTTTRPWSAWWAPVWGLRSFRNSPSSPYGRRGRAR